MKQTFAQYKKGYLRIRLKGFSPERFLNLCMANEIEIWDLKYLDDGYVFYISLDGYRRVRPLVKKAQVRLLIMEKCGFPFFLYRNKKRKLYVAGVTAFFLILFVMSRFIWNISLEGNYRFTDDMLRHFLDENQIRYGVLKRSVDCDNLEEAIRSRYPEIIWVSARISGTKLMIRVKENEVMGTIPLKDTTPRDLVADKDGVVTGMVVRKGKAQVQVGDTVTKGQVLISGVIPIYNDSEELVNQQLVRADGDILAQTSYQYEETFSGTRNDRIRTGKERHGIQIRVLNRACCFLLPVKGENPWEFVRESHQASILGDFFLPVWIEHITGKEYQISGHILTDEEAELEKSRIHQLKMENLLAKGVQIIENNVKITDEGAEWKIQGDFLVEEPIGTGQQLNLAEESKPTE